MKIKVPTLSFDKNEGFCSEKDIFLRKDFGENLFNVIDGSDDGMVVGLSASWGEGKTTFAKMWFEYLTNEGVKAIYFDAFKNDYNKQSFYAITSEIYQLLEKEDVRLDFKKSAISAVQVISNVSVKAGVRLLRANFVDAESLKNIASDVNEEVTKATGQYIDSKFQSAKEDKVIIDKFSKILESLPSKLNTEHHIIIIDELDRCRPDFSLEIIESIKHFFSVPKISFILIMHKMQLEETISHKYGLKEGVIPL